MCGNGFKFGVIIVAMLHVVVIDYNRLTTTSIFFNSAE